MRGTMYSALFKIYDTYTVYDMYNWRGDIYSSLTVICWKDTVDKDSSKIWNIFIHFVTLFIEFYFKQ